jgi:spore germination protein KA
LPDIAAGRILEGRVGIMCDGTPHFLTIPELFIENIHTAEDYYNRVIITAFLRFLRILGLFISVMLPGLAIAVMTFNHEMMPPVFLVNLISSMEKTPLPAGAEIFLLMIMFELLRESGTRLPKTIGSAISIVGALIIGEAAVNAGIVSAPTVIIVALTAVSSFILPNLTEFIIYYRFLFIILGGSMGLIGIGSGIMLLLTQLCSLESFGVPIFASFSGSDLKDSVIKLPIKFLKYRPYAIAKDNVKRINFKDNKIIFKNDEEIDLLSKNYKKEVKNYVFS